MEIVLYNTIMRDRDGAGLLIRGLGGVVRARWRRWRCRQSSRARGPGCWSWGCSRRCRGEMARRRFGSSIAGRHRPWRRVLEMIDEYGAASESAEE